MQAIQIKITLIFFLSTIFINAQEIEKQNIYLIFNQNDGTQHQALGKKFKNKNGINFNLYKYYFLHKKEFKRDTLDINELPCLSIIEEKDIEKLEKKFREDNHNNLMLKYPGGYPPFSRNFIFNTNIIEIHKDKLIVYEVIFRNEGIQGGFEID